MLEREIQLKNLPLGPRFPRTESAMSEYFERRLEYTLQELGEIAFDISRQIPEEHHFKGCKRWAALAYQRWKKRAEAEQKQNESDGDTVSISVSQVFLIL